MNRLKILCAYAVIAANLWGLLKAQSIGLALFHLICVMVGMFLVEVATWARDRNLP